VKLLLPREDVDPDIPDENGRTPLSHAAMCSSEGTVRLLLQRRDVDPSSSDKDGITPLVHAAGCGGEGVLELLLERVKFSPDSPDGDGMRALLWAAAVRYEGAVRLLLERTDVDRVCCGPEELADAARSGCEVLVELLLQRGCLDTEWSDANGRTQLSCAAEGGVRGL